MVELLANGRLVDGILALMLAEGAVLVLYRMRTGGGVPALPLVANLAAGACLLLALRAAMTGAGPAQIWPLLAAALFAHVLDLRLRWRGRE
jgi:hypothetical protein